MRITVETNVAAPIDQVWRAYTTPADIVKWNAASDDWHTTKATVELREGGAFSSRMEAKDGSMGFDFAGTYTKIVEHERIEYAFGDRKAEIEFVPGPRASSSAIPSTPKRRTRSSSSKAAGRRSSTASRDTWKRSEEVVKRARAGESLTGAVGFPRRVPDGN